MPEAATRRTPSRTPCSSSIPRPPGAPRSSPNARLARRTPLFGPAGGVWPTPHAAPRPSCVYPFPLALCPPCRRPDCSRCASRFAAVSVLHSHGIPAPILTLGLPEEAFERENNLITASDVRAVILSRLRLPAWGTLWDVGAGSGSVGLEAAALRPNLNVLGIERKPERGAMIERNRPGWASPIIRSTRRRPLELNPCAPPRAPAFPTPCGGPLPSPTPDRVFIGGGGRDLPALLTACWKRLRPDGLMAASAVTLESFRALPHGLPTRGPACAASTSPTSNPSPRRATI